MKSILQEILQIRGQKPLIIDYENSNRYCLLAKERNGSTTAYCFSVPIYNKKSRSAVDLKFRDFERISAIVSSAEITITDSIYLEREGEYFRLSPVLNPMISQGELSQPAYESGKAFAFRRLSEREVVCEKDSIFPTTNGIMYKAYVPDSKQSRTFELEVKTPFMPVHANDRCFALMKEEFRPFGTVACLGTCNDSGEIIAPACIEYEKTNDRKYKLTLFPCKTHCEADGRYVMFEVNLYEPKIFQDTTVESMNPQTNNAYGSIAFIGRSPEFGEQWLYSRPDFSRLPEITDKYINHARLYIPKLNNSETGIKVSGVASRFCSFASNWENKVAESTEISDPVSGGRYLSIDFTDIIRDPVSRCFMRTEGVIIKPDTKLDVFSVISTGDSYYAPQIFEVNYNK